MPNKHEVDEMIASYTPEESELMRELLEDEDYEEDTDQENGS